MSSKVVNIVKFGVVILVIFVSLFAFVLYYPNVKSGTNNILFITKQDNFDSIKEHLYKNKNIKIKSTFELIAKLKHYNSNVKPGRYLLDSNMSNVCLIDKLRSGNQDPSHVTFGNIRNIESVAKLFGETLMLDSAQIIKILYNKKILQHLGFNRQTVISMFIPNTYEVYWTIKPSNLLERLKKEYNVFWNPKRRKLAKKIGLSQVQVSTLASIVDQETAVDSENRRVAGVYMNRLKRKIRLCADPTVIFATGDFSIRRVLNKHLRFKSPYNTYLNLGLPPGPISIPSVSAIDAVLNYEHHNYLYFCVNPDFSGTHKFASTLSKHNKNAREFRKELSRRGIYK